MNTPSGPDAAPLIHALALLAQEWACSIQEAQDRLETTCAVALVAAGAGLDNNDPVPRLLAECLLRRDLDGFDTRIRQACRRMTIMAGVYPNVGDYHRHGFQDDGPLRTALYRVTAARPATTQPTTAGLLAAIEYAESMAALCRRKRTLLKHRKSASSLGYLVIRRLPDESEESSPHQPGPTGKTHLLKSRRVSLASPAAPFFLMGWLLRELE